MMIFFSHKHAAFHSDVKRCMFVREKNHHKDVFITIYSILQLPF